MKGLFFDLYGTLLLYGDMEKAWAEWLHNFYVGLSAHGLVLSQKEFSKECDLFFAKDEPTLPKENLTVLEKRIKALCCRLKVSIDDADIGCLADLIVGKWQAWIRPDPEAVPVLNELKGRKVLGLVSNFDHPRHVWKCLSRYGLLGFFESVVISGDVGVKKPDPAIFHPALSATGLTPAQVAYVGDTEEDMQAANAAGMTAILIRRQDDRATKGCLDFQHHARHGSAQVFDKAENEHRTISTLRELLTV